MLGGVSGEVLIIGGGPAGAVAGIALARGGAAGVTLLEQARFPRDKVCGECLSTLGIGVLAALGLSDVLQSSLNPVRLRRTILHPAGEPATVEIPLPAAMWGVSRAALDAFLLRAAAAAGARVLQPARCERLDPLDGGRWRGLIRDIETGKTSTIDAAVVVVADGKSALPAGRPAASGDLGVKSHWAGVAGAPTDAIELFGLEGHYGGIAPVETGLFNLSFSVPATLAKRFGGDLDAMFAFMASQNDRLRDRLAGSRRAGAWHASPLPRFAVRDGWPAGVIPVGNAAAAIEPIGGEGMGLAMRSAQLAADAILTANRLGRPVDARALRSAYCSLWNTRRLACRALAQLLSRPTIAHAAAALVDGAPAVGRLALHLVGK